MNKKLLLALLLAASLAACHKKTDTAGTTDVTAAPAAAAQDTASSTAADTTASASAAPAAANDATPKPLTVTAPELAYAYDYSVQAPARDVPHLVRQHEAECAMAGATVCQVVGATTKAIGHDDVSGRLEIRATPAWIAKFRDRIEDDVKALGGKISAAETNTDDLSGSLVDTQAALRAKIELRDRLETLLKTHNGKIKDLVDLEQRVSDVQSDIDQAQSELAVMKTRVQTSKLVIEYSSLSVMAPDSAFHPLAQSAHSFTRHVAAGVAVIIDMISVILPFALVIGGGVWIFYRKRRRPTLPQPSVN
jgi:uncharacterized protein YlxW (UPF0749 family)